MLNYKKLTKHISESIAALFSSTGSYTSTQNPHHAYYGKTEKLAVNYDGILRNPVILIPGFLESSLVDTKTGINIWDFTELRISMCSLMLLHTLWEA